MAINNKKDKELLDKYLKQFTNNRFLCLVDEGWYCSSQITIEKELGYKIQGYYIGIMGRNKDDSDIKRKGILFDIDENGKMSQLFGVFRTNCTFYEQLLSAPHGSTIGYEEVNNQVEAIEDWKEIEKENYLNRIKGIQEIIIDYFTGLEVWKCELSKYHLATLVLKQLMFGYTNRIKLEEQILGSWFDNANDTKEKTFGRAKDIKVKLDIIYKPENYLRYFCKLKSLKLKHVAIKIIYPVLGTLIYLYCYLFIFVRYRKEEN